MKNAYLTKLDTTVLLIFVVASFPLHSQVKNSAELEKAKKELQQERCNEEKVIVSGFVIILELGTKLFPDHGQTHQHGGFRPGR